MDRRHSLCELPRTCRADVPSDTSDCANPSPVPRSYAFSGRLQQNLLHPAPLCSSNVDPNVPAKCSKVAHVSEHAFQFKAHRSNSYPSPVPRSYAFSGRLQQNLLHPAPLCSSNVDPNVPAKCGMKEVLL